MEIIINKSDIASVAEELNVSIEEMFASIRRLHLIAERAVGWNPMTAIGGISTANFTNEDVLETALQVFGKKWGINPRLIKAFNNACWWNNKFSHPSYKDVIWMVGFTR